MPSCWRRAITQPQSGRVCGLSAGRGLGGLRTPPRYPPRGPCFPLVGSETSGPARTQCTRRTGLQELGGRPDPAPPVGDSGQWGRLRRPAGAHVAGVTRPPRRTRASRGGGGRPPPAWPSRTTGLGLSPQSVEPLASPPCARSATSNSLHCPAPPRSRPSPSSQPFTPPNRQGRPQEGPVIRGRDSAGQPGCATAAPGGPEPSAPGRSAPALCAPARRRAGRGAEAALAG